ncbi:MAG: hypothetical protein SGI73_19400 [Chloroflexota bacterium]|nr:hypothetical protein [Chloroflexota bacterium]
MPTKPILERVPIGDPFDGVAFNQNGVDYLAVEAVALPPNARLLHRGALIVRYGIRYLGKPYLAVVPGLVALDYGELLNGEAAWTFITKRSNLYPRADVVGFRSDGRDEMITVKNLDLALPFQVLVYSDARATTPIARPITLIADDDTAAALPARLLAIIPRVSAWQDIEHD